MDAEYDKFVDNMIDYIDNIEFSNNSKEDVIFANRNIVRDSISTFFNRFKNENNFNKQRLRVFNKKVEKLFNIMLGVILRYIRFIPNVYKNNCKIRINDLNSVFNGGIKIKTGFMLFMITFVCES